MKEMEQIQDQLQKAYAGPAWLGPSLKEILSGVTAEKASARPVAKAHTIWEIVLHIDAWQREVIEKMHGIPVTYTTEQDWPALPEATEAGWKKTLEQLDETHRKFMLLLSSLPEDTLAKTVPGETYDFYFCLHGVIQHSLFHAGQIAVLKRA